MLQDAQIKNKRIFLRVDFNVPIEEGKIVDNNRIKAVIPTLKYLVGAHAKIIIGTHCGRPEGKSSSNTSIAPIAKELQRLLNLKVTMAPDITGPEVEKLADALQPGGMLVLENLRWDKREEENDTLFAQELAKLADIYVNDAFAVSHRANASVEAIANYLPAYAGPLLQNEIDHLSKIVNKPEHPFVLIIGGIKVKDKVGVLSRLAPLAEKILIGGEVGNTFLKAAGVEIGKSSYDEDMVSICKDLLKDNSTKIVLPIDFVKDHASNDFQIMDIGPDSGKAFAAEISKAKMVFWNGNMGYSEKPEYADGMRTVAEAMNEVRGTTVMAGGNTVGFVIQAKLDKNISFISTGGGASLEFLAGKELPGIKALNS